MAITTLPRAGPGSVGEGGVRKKARPIDAGDVPTQGVLKGVGAPDLTAVGRGIQDLGQGAANLVSDIKARDDRLAAANERINKRRDSVERLRAGREFNDSGNKLFTDFSSSRDLSRTEDIEEFGATLNAEMERIVADHRGSEESKLLLREKLSPIMQSISDKAAVASVKAQDALVDAEFKNVVDGVYGSVRGGRSGAEAEEEAMAFLESEKDSLRPKQEIAIEQNIKSARWRGEIDNFMSNGALNDAEVLMGDPEVRSAVGEKVAKDVFDRIAKARIEGKTRLLTPAEMAGMRIPPETIAAGLNIQVNEKGDYKMVYNPPKDGDEASREKQIKAIEKQKLAEGMAPEEALDFATNVTDGNISFEITQDGFAREINAIEGTVKEVPLGTVGDSSTAPAVPQETLFEIAARGDTAGVAGAVKSFISKTLGQLSNEFVFEQAGDDRQTIVNVLSEMVRALSINPRFPVGEINRIIEQINIEPKILDSPGALISRLGAIRRSMAIRLQNEESAAADPNLPVKTRSAAAQTAKDIKNFMAWLGGGATETSVPQGLPTGSIRTGTTETGEKVWTTPDGTPMVVE